MLFIQYLLFITGIAMLVSAIGLVVRTLQQKRELDRRLKSSVPGESVPRPVLTWTRARNLALGLFVAELVGATIAVIPSGVGGVRVSRLSGNWPTAFTAQLGVQMI